MPKQLERLRDYLRGIYKYRIQSDDDLVLPVVGAEGAGKSTLMAQAVWIYQDIRGVEPTPDSVLDRMVWGKRPAFKDALLEGDQGQAIAVQDAAHVLYAKETMVGEQVDIEKALLDTRVNNYLIILGFQDWSDIPDGLRRRRAENVLRVIKKREQRGFYEGYGRAALDEKYGSTSKSDWPEPDWEGRFPSLEGTELWEEFQRRDNEAKEERLEDSQEIEVDDARKQEQIKTALRAVKPWDTDRGMTYREAEKLVDFSRNWISERVQEWEDGHHRELLGQDENRNRKKATG